jgi:hypothetical protein
MATPLFPSTIIPPSQTSYRVKKPLEFIQVELEGGETRTRRDKIGATYTVDCQWQLTPEQYGTISGFFRDRLQNGVRIFRIPLKIDVAALVEYRARFLGEPEELTANEGLLHVVSARLEVLPNPIVSFNLICQNVSDTRVIAGNNPDFNTNMDQFPIGRQVLLTGCKGIVNTIPLDLDGTFTIASKPSPAICVLSGTGSNPDWATLNTTLTQALSPNQNAGACILLPE